MDAKKIIESKQKMMFTTKEKRKISATNCLNDYRLVVDTYKKLLETSELLESETIKSKRLKLLTKCILLSKKLTILWKKWKKIEAHYHACIPIEADVPASTIFPHNITNVFISAHSKIGEGCVIFQDVTIGSSTLSDSKKHGSPIIGNNVYIGSGATILGNITIGDNARIGANTTVVENVEENTTCVSQPAIKIKHKEKRENHQW